LSLSNSTPPVGINKRFGNNSLIAGKHPDVVKRLLGVWKKGNTGLYDKPGMKQDE
jgi:hypothetical protein